MIKRINISKIDRKNIMNCFSKKNSDLKNFDFSGVVVNKPWGYEYLMFGTEEVSIWMLHIKKGHSTSIHCHPNKKTSLMLILGEAICSTLNEKFFLKEKEGLIFDRGVFHTTEAVSENGAFIIEVETPSDKMDLVRLKDNYNRETQTYTAKKNITDKTYNYHYLHLKNKKDSTNLFGKYRFLVRSFNTNGNFFQNIEKTEADVAVLLSGGIQTGEELLTAGDIIEIEKLKQSIIKKPTELLLIHERKNLTRLSDYVISFLEKQGVKNVFLVSGGNLIYLLESLRTNKNISYICNHHEQAATMAAESYSKMTNDLGFAMVTSGPGGTNAITGVAGAWIDSNPVLVISGQSYHNQTIGNSGMRQLGVQELNIVDIVRPITKYAVMVRDPKKIRYHLEKALYIACSGRPGPVWIDIPIDIQLALIEEKNLEPFKPQINKKIIDKKFKEKVKELIELIKNSKRPIILLGNGVRLGKSEKEFFEMAEKLDIPIVTSRNANDLIWETHNLYAGRIGSFGQRAANFAVQNSDILLSIGSRINLAVTGWAYNDFARNAKKVVVDVDKTELKKQTINTDLAINCEVKDFVLEMLSQLTDYKKNGWKEWKEKIQHWKMKYPVILPEYKQEKAVNTYYFTGVLSEELNENDVVVTDMGMSFQCVMQAFKLKKGQRLFTSSGLASMGWGLPGAIGACKANKNKRVICITGDGGLMMNIQELQTLKSYNLPIKLFIFNNKGYSSIRETQKTYFKGYLGVDRDSGVSMPDFMKVAEAHGLKTKRIENQERLKEEIKEVLEYSGPVICELNISENQPVQPKQGTFNRPDGKTVPRPIEDMLPYLDRKELEEEMIIEPVPFDPYRE